MAKLHPMAVVGLVRELQAAAGKDGPLAVAGARELAGALAKELARDGAASAVRDGFVEHAEVLVYVLAGAPTAEDERVLQAARRAKVPVIAVLAGPELDAKIPYVLATDVVRVPAGSGFPVDEIARAVARRLGEEATPLAARLPVLRRAVCDELVESFSRKNALIAVAVFFPGADLAALTLNQLRLVLRLASAHGVDVDQQRAPEIMAVIGSGLAFRAAARQVVGLVPFAGWAVKGAIAYAGTRALGEAAVRYFEARASGS